MQVFRRVPALAASPSVLTIGNFDGVHLGHKSLLARLKQKANALGLPATVLCFEPHPREFFAPDNAPPRLTNLRRKLELMEEAGVDQVFIQRFDNAFASLDAQAFVDRILVKGLQVRDLMIGDDFRFGKGREGDFAALMAAGQQYGFEVEAMDTLIIAEERASSSAVRDALLAGEIEHATRLLGEPFVLEGRVLHGDKIGRTIGFPTANIHLKQNSLPLSGIFAVTVDGGSAESSDWRGKHRRASHDRRQIGAARGSLRTGLRGRFIRTPFAYPLLAQGTQRREIRIAGSAQSGHSG